MGRRSKGTPLRRRHLDASSRDPAAPVDLRRDTIVVLESELRKEGAVHFTRVSFLLRDASIEYAENVDVVHEATWDLLSCLTSRSEQEPALLEQLDPNHDTPAAKESSSDSRSEDSVPFERIFLPKVSSSKAINMKKGKGVSLCLRLPAPPEVLVMGPLHSGPMVPQVNLPEEKEENSAQVSTLNKSSFVCNQMFDDPSLWEDDFRILPAEEEEEEELLQAEDTTCGKEETVGPMEPMSGGSIDPDTPTPLITSTPRFRYPAPSFVPPIPDSGIGDSMMDPPGSSASLAAEAMDEEDSTLMEQGCLSSTSWTSLDSDFFSSFEETETSTSLSDRKTDPLQVASCSTTSTTTPSGTSWNSTETKQVEETESNVTDDTASNEETAVSGDAVEPGATEDATTKSHPKPEAKRVEKGKKATAARPVRRSERLAKKKTIRVCRLEDDAPAKKKKKKQFAASDCEETITATTDETLADHDNNTAAKGASSKPGNQSKFVLKDYRKKVLGMFGSGEGEDEHKEFRTAVSGLGAVEISRCFVSLLFLANEQVLEILPPTDDGDKPEMDSFRVGRILK